MIDEKLKERAFNPPHKGEKNPRKKILALGKKITDVIPHKLLGINSDDPEYWGLASIVTDEMADIALEMKVRHHYTISQMWELCKVKEEDKPHFQELLDEMCYIGLLEFDYGNHYDHNGRTAPQSERRYCLSMFVPGSAEMFNMEEGPEGNKRLREHPDVAYFFERMAYIPLAGKTHLVPPGGGGIGMHVIPVEKAISMENQTMDIEHLSYWLKKYEGKLGVGQCSCRASRAAMGEGCADDEQCWCIGVGDFADYCRETGKGHDITYEEAMHILQVAEDNGFVHQITNIDGENKIFGICNCNVNICNGLRTSQLFNTQPSTPKPTQPQSSQPVPTQPAATEPPATTAPAQSNPLTPDGTGSILDEATGDDDKQFYTITTAAGNVFYLIVDGQRDSENVYFLNGVTEEDLMALAEESNGAVSVVPAETCSCVDKCEAGNVYTGCTICMKDLRGCLGKEKPTEETQPPTEPVEEPESSGNGGMVLLALVSMALVAGIGYYVKIELPKQRAQDEDDFEDDGYGEGFDPSEAFSEDSYLPEDDENL